MAVLGPQSPGRGVRGPAITPLDKEPLRDKMRRQIRQRHMGSAVFENMEKVKSVLHERARNAQFAKLNPAMAQIRERISLGLAAFRRPFGSPADAEQGSPNQG